MLRPDLALVTAATGKIWLAAEIVDSHDHRPDTVLKKGLYEDYNLARLWMIDPRYNNGELYHGDDLRPGPEGNPGRPRKPAGTPAAGLCVDH